MHVRDHVRFRCLLLHTGNPFHCVAVPWLHACHIMSLLITQMVKSKGSAFGPPPRSFGALLVPDISSEFYKAQVTYLDGTPLLLAGLISTGQGCRNSLFQIDLKYSRLKVPFFLFLSSSLQNPSNPKVGTSPTAWATTWAV